MEEEQQPWPFWKKLLHAAFWATLIYILWYGAAKLALWVTGTG